MTDAQRKFALILEVYAAVAAAAAAREVVDQAVAQARAQGASWPEIGDALGVSRQAAQQRYGGG